MQSSLGVGADDIGLGVGSSTAKTFVGIKVGAFEQK